MAHSTLPSFDPQHADQHLAPFRAPGRPLPVGLLLSLRPSQWTKNLIIFAGLIFGQRLLDARSVLQSVAAFAIFCVLSGVVYLVNDVADRDAGDIPEFGTAREGNSRLVSSVKSLKQGRFLFDVTM